MRKQVRIPSADAVIVEANAPLRKMMNCTEGLFLSNLGPKSFFLQATPPIPQKSFLTKVRGIEIDQFGMGWDKNYCEDRVQYTDLLFMQDDITGTVEVETCHQGTMSKHTVPLDWRSEAYEVGIRYVEEPEFEDDLTQYVLFGDIAIMQLTFNHIESLYKYNPLLAGYLLPEERKQNRLVLPFVMPGSYAGEFLMPGDIIRKVNGHEVFDIEDFKTHFIPDELKDDAALSPAGPAPCDQAASSSSSATAEEIKEAVEAAVAEAMRNLQNGQDSSSDSTSSTTTTTTTEASEALVAASVSIAKSANASLTAEPLKTTKPGFLQSKAKIRPSSRQTAGVKKAALHKVGAKARNESYPDADGYGDEYGEYGEDDGESGIFTLPMDPVEETADAASDEGKVVWTLETEGGHIYAVFFDDMLEEQVQEAETSESAYLMTSVVLQAASRRNILKRSPLPLVRGLLEKSSKPAHLQLRSANARPFVPPPASKLRAEIPVKKAGRGGGWRPTVQSSFPQVHLS